MTKKENQDDLEYECPECGEPVSGIVYSCPKCGTAFEDEEEVEDIQEGYEQEDDIEQESEQEDDIEQESEQEDDIQKDDLEEDDTPYYLLEYSEDELYIMLGTEIIEIDRLIKERESKSESRRSRSEVGVSSGPVQYSPSVEPESDDLRGYIDREEEEIFRRERLRRMREERYRKITIGKRFFDGSREKLFFEICIKFKYCEKCREYKDVNSAFYAIMGIISTFFLPGSIGGILGAILIKRKLERFCRCGY